MYKMMTPGPTQVAENVRMARSQVTTNPDVDQDFCEFYHETTVKLGKLLGTDNPLYILGGEGILALEAACASLTESGDRVLVIDNGIFGKGFADFVTIYGGEPVLYTTDYKRPVNLDELAKMLEKDHDFKYATLVHLDTPSGVCNDISTICPLLKKYGIVTVVDSVAGMFGEEVQVDKDQIDILCGGSQKVISAPPGLAFVTVSPDALNIMKNRKTPIASFYCNLLTFEHYYEEKWFPYTMPISDIMGFRQAIDNIEKEKTIVARHKKIAEATRAAVLEAGLTLYLEEGYGNTVTVVNVPKETTCEKILDEMKNEYGILLAGCFDILKDKVIRIGHMGNNANVEDMKRTLDALTKTLESLGVPIQKNMKETFIEVYGG